MPRKRREPQPPESFPVIDPHAPGFIQYECQHDGYGWSGTSMEYVLCPRCRRWTRRDVARRLARGGEPPARIEAWTKEMPLRSRSTLAVCEEPSCPRNGEPFSAARSDARYCSTRCRMRAHRRRSQLVNGRTEE